jgi:tetratricopeptide (TPR) repeat protein
LADREAALAALRGQMQELLPRNPLRAPGLRARRAARRVWALGLPEADSEAAVLLGLYHALLAATLPNLVRGRDLQLAAILLSKAVHADPPAAAALIESAVPISRPEQDSSRLSLLLALDVLMERGDQAFAIAEHTSALDPVQKAIELYGAAVRVCPADSADFPRAQHAYGTALRTLAERTGDLTALDGAVAAHRTAAQASFPDHPDRAPILSGLGLALFVLFEQTGQSGALAESVDLGRAAARFGTAADAHRAIVLSNLGVSLRAAFEQSGQLGLAAEAVTAARYAVKASIERTEQDPFRYRWLGNLGSALLATGKATGQTDLIAEAVDVCESAVRAAAPDDPHLANGLANLGAALWAHADVTERTDLLARSVQAYRAAAAAAADGSPLRSGVLTGLGSTLDALAEDTGDRDLLEEAANAHRAAVAAAPPGHADHARWLSNLGGTLIRLYERTGRRDVLDEALQRCREAEAASRDDRAERGGILVNLGIALTTRAEADQPDEASADQARACFRQAADLAEAPTAVRIQAARELARLAIAADKPDEALGALETAVELAERLHSTALLRKDRQHWLSRLGGLPAQAAAAALAAGKPQRAVELLEQTRAVLVTETLGLRNGERERLRAADPNLADELDRARSALAAADSVATDRYQPARQAVDAVAQLRARRSGEVAGVLDRIRALPGFADFLRPSLAQLAAHACAGPVVYLIAELGGCAALIVTAGPPPAVRHVPLPDLDWVALIELSERLDQARRAVEDPELPGPVRAAGRAALADLFGHLWDAAAEPVLEALGHRTTPEDGHWPRLWWCPVDIATFVPWHAAGHHGDPADRPGGPRTVLDRVVSSYTPTIRALPGPGSEPAPPPEAVDRSGALVITARDTAGGSLPAADWEAAEISRLIPGVRVLADPGVRAALDALPQSRIVHFACHAATDWNDPARSHFAVADGAELTVADLGRLDLAADLAFLSACATATGAPQLADESIHLAGALNLAGFRHVISTMWPVGDEVAAALAVDFYQRSTKDGACPPRTDGAAIAEALHHAIRALRRRRALFPGQWAGHIHTGA